MLLSPMDAMFLRMESRRAPLHIGALMTFTLPEDAGAGFTRTLHAEFSTLVARLHANPLALSRPPWEAHIIEGLSGGYGLNITLVGYADNVALGFVGCRDTIPHLQHLAVYAGEALTELEHASAA